jgi:predicted secreted protein
MQRKTLENKETKMIEKKSALETLLVKNADDIFYCEEDFELGLPVIVELNQKDLEIAVNLFGIKETSMYGRYIVMVEHDNGSWDEVFFESTPLEIAMEVIELEKIAKLGHSKRMTTRI